MRNRPTGTLDASIADVAPQAPALKPRVNRLSAVPSLARHTSWMTSSIVASICGGVSAHAPLVTCSAPPQAVPFQRLAIRLWVVPLVARHITALVPLRLIVPAASASVPLAVATSCAPPQATLAPLHRPRFAYT